MTSYPKHFKAFIQRFLPTFNETFTVEDMIAWVQSTEPQRKPMYIRDHLLKRTTNYEPRDNFDPPSSTADDLFFQVGPNLVGRYQPDVDPKPFHLGCEETGDKLVTAPDEVVTVMKETTKNWLSELGAVVRSGGTLSYTTLLARNESKYAYSVDLLLQFNEAAQKPRDRQYIELYKQLVSIFILQLTFLFPSSAAVSIRINGLKYDAARIHSPDESAAD